MRLVALPVLAFSLSASLLSATAAFAADCPPGSVSRSQDGYSFCEPTVCQNDGQCNPEEVCRPVALCMQVGTLDVDAATLGGAAAKRLVVTQQCAPDKSCPQTTTCSDMGRCLSKGTAEKLGILTKTDAKTAPAPADAAKKACGCGVVGTDHASGGFLAVLAGVVVATTRAARGRRARSRRAQ